MKNLFNTPVKAFLAVSLLLGFSLSTASIAAVTAPVSLATSPLANSTVTAVKPNMMFILDNSGSMVQDYTPDYISDIFNTPATTDKQCRDSGDDDGGTAHPGLTSGGTRVLDMCVIGDPPYTNSDMNSQYYNPAIRYQPGVQYDGVSWGDQTDSTNVRTDPYNKQNRNQLLDTATNVNIQTSYPDRLWCTINNPTAVDKSNPAVCRKNSGYLYPNATFKYGRTSGGPDQQVTAGMLDGVIMAAGAPYYYSVVPTEHCTSANLKNCTLSSVPVGAYTFPARSRWCDSALLTNCQSIRATTFIWPRYVGVSTTATAATGSFQVTTANSGTTDVASIKVNGIEIMGGGGAGCGTATSAVGDNSATRLSKLATAIAAKINACTSNPEYTATSSGQTVSITSTAAAGSAGNGNITFSGATNSAVLGSVVNMAGGTGSATTPPYTFARVDINNSAAMYQGSNARSDCAAKPMCTYSEEMTNFGNWYSYYRTRMQAMKSAASLSFKSIDNRFRVGFITIANQSSAGNYLPIASFDAGAGNQKANWYTTLFGINPSTSTPLRSALTTVGRIFAGKNPVFGYTADPVQYSCQQNFALLTTDGYWNTDSAADVKNIAGTGTVGNKDSATTPRGIYEGPTASLNSLADAARYYYSEDLRSAANSNCTGALGLDVCEDNVFVSDKDRLRTQHMTTFTMGLGIDGTLIYQSDYEDAKPGDDYYSLINGLGSPQVNWPVPVANTESAIDDLWHAAVNGNGIYFSAKSPDQIVTGLTKVLNSITAKLGSGAAAATSTLNPVAGDNYAYVASYTTGNWSGNLEARTINVNTGVVSEVPTWCVEEIPISATAPKCDGRMNVPGAIAARKIWTKGPGASTLNNFKLTGGDLSAADFNATKLAGLSQWALLDTTQKTAAVGDNIVNFLRGDKTFEGNAADPDNRLFRERQATLGDAVESQPAYIAKSTFDYLDSGYSAFKTGNLARAGTVYIGANDGMMHAFDSQTGDERWAYVPTMLIPNMWALAEKNYSTNHLYYANGSPVVSDVFIGGVWKTILVAGLNGGGRGYYALDVTNPSAPSLLWEFTTTAGTGNVKDDDLGYTYGKPVITKKADGTWVVLVTSGYNNIPDVSCTPPAPALQNAPGCVKYPQVGSTGNGQGYLYVLNAATGVKLGKIGTGVGSVSVPSGLAQITSYAEAPERNNTATVTYGGDLLGNVWRFDINANTVMQFAELKDSGGAPQPITTRPELGKVLASNGKVYPVVFVGTGKYLENSDLTDTQQQTLYAIKDDAATASLVNPRSFTSGPNRMVEQTIITVGSIREASNNPVDFISDRGWFVNFPDTRERQNVASQLVLGTLIVPTTVPSNTVCAPGGTSWLNYFNYRTGGAVDTATNQVSSIANAPIVGVNVIYVLDPVTGKRKPVVSVVTADNPTPTVVPGAKFSTSGSGFQKKRVIWRELVK